MSISSQTGLKTRPLAKRTIVITRARAQADEFANLLEEYGARVISCPTIEVIEPESYESLDEAIENLYGYDWLIFTSVNGIKFFLSRFSKLGHENHELDELRVCAIGDSSAAALRDSQVHVDVVPEQFQAEGVFIALRNYLGDVDAFRNLNFLIPRAAAARDYLQGALEEVGARVDVVTAYRTVRPSHADLGRVVALLEGGAIDCITFASSSSVTNFANLIDTTDLGHLLRGVSVACIGEVTARTVAQFGLQVAIQPREHTIVALADAIADYYESVTHSH